MSCGWRVALSASAACGLWLGALVLLVDCLLVDGRVAPAWRRWRPRTRTGGPAWRRALPANASPTPRLPSPRCRAPRRGTAPPAAGTSTARGTAEGLLQSQSSGAWAAGIEAPLPANAGANPATEIDSVSCASAGDCSAVANYRDSSNDRQGVLWTESSGAWATGVEASLPADAPSQPFVFFSSVSCASAGDCSAVGGYVDGSGSFQGLLLTETAGTWGTGVEASLPADAGAIPNVGLTSVSCASAGNCTAVGTYTDSSNDSQGACC